MNRQRGVALVMALLIVALATIVAVAIIVRASAELRRTEMLLHGDQALQYVLGAEAWVLQILRRDRTDSDVDTLGEPWALELPPLPVDGGVVIGRLEDLNGRFNLGNLVAADGSSSAPDLVQFRRLLAALGASEAVSESAVVDFLDANGDVTLPDGVEDALYLAADPPYRAPNQRVAALSELALVHEFDMALLPVLAPHVVAVPVRTRLNANTLTAPVLMSLGEGIAEAHATGLVEAYRDDGYESVAQFAAVLGAPVEPGLELGLTSDWFRLTVQVNIGSTTLTMYSLLERSPQGPIRVVARSQTPW